MYATSDQKIIELLINSKIQDILQQANKIRNDSQGHGGAIGDEQAKFIHGDLFNLVQELRGVYGRSWLNYQMIQPQSGRYKNGIHEVNCKRIMGSRSSPFVEMVFKSEHALESNSLYLFDEVNQSGLKLQPFIEVIPSPVKQAVACFFYNRIEQEGARWISYHFEQESEITHQMPLFFEHSELLEQ